MRNKSYYLSNFFKENKLNLASESELDESKCSEFNKSINFSLISFKSDSDISILDEDNSKLSQKEIKAARQKLKRLERTEEEKNNDKAKDAERKRKQRALEKDENKNDFKKPTCNYFKQ